MPSLPPYTSTKAATLFILGGYLHAKIVAGLSRSQKETQRRRGVLGVLFPGSSDHTTDPRAPPAFEDKGFFVASAGPVGGPPVYRAKNIPL